MTWIPNWVVTKLTYLCLNNEQWCLDFLHFMLEFNEFRFTLCHKLVEKWNGRHNKIVDKSHHPLLFDGRNLKTSNKKKSIHLMKMGGFWNDGINSWATIKNCSLWKLFYMDLVSLIKFCVFLVLILNMHRFLGQFTWLLSTLSLNIERSELSFIFEHMLILHPCLVNHQFSPTKLQIRFALLQIQILFVQNCVQFNFRFVT